MTPLRLMVVSGSTRPTRLGRPVADWVLGQAQVDERYDAHLVDLAELGLPLLDEPEIPRLGGYQHDHTREWAAQVDACDAFVVVTPEYNHAPPPALLNAIDFLFAEWRWKAAGIVSYGGVAGGVRAAQVVKHVLAAVSVFTVHDAVAVPVVTDHVRDGVFTPPPGTEQATATMLGTLSLLAGDLRAGRSSRG